jgi:hypothetical protein
MLNRYSITAIVLILIVVAAYIIQFYFRLGYPLSDKVSDWVNFSDYVSGLISPVLSFISLVLLIKSLNLQNEANKELRSEINLNQKNEKMRSFETYFLGLIDAQRSSFSNFKLTFLKTIGDKPLTGVCAIQELEDLIEGLRNEKLMDADIAEEIDNIDTDEKIFNTIRIFYNIVKMISDKLSDLNGFNSEVRKSQYLTLINFTEFSQLRLVMISMQFMDWKSTEYLKSNIEFMEVLEEMGGSVDLY